VAAQRAVTDVRADVLPDGWRHWRDFERAIELSGLGHFPSDAEALDTDAGRWISFVRVVADAHGRSRREPVRPCPRRHCRRRWLNPDLKSQ
jgi:hypothetical protein